MKKIISIIMSVLMLAGILASYPVSATEPTPQATPIAADTSWYNTTDNEFTITTAAELLGMASVVASDTDCFRYKTIKLGADIVLNEGNAEDWETTPPVNSMNMVATFKGTFDGQGHTISGLYRVGTAGTQGLLFGEVNREAKIKNFAILNSYFKTGGSMSGGIAGRVTALGTYVKFENVYVDAIIRSTHNQVGGFVGANQNNCFTVDFENCVFAGDIKTTMAYAGGIVGDFSLDSTDGNTFTNCLNVGSIESTVTAETARVGGIAGLANKVTFEKCVNLGFVSGNDRVAGILGQTSSGGITISNCYIATDVATYKGNGSNESLYGYIGINGATISNSTKITTTQIKGEAAKTVMTALDWENTWTTTENGLPMIKYFAALHDKLTEPKTPKYVGAQTKAGSAANTADVRFTGLIGDYKDYETIGFKFTYNGKEEVVNCLKVYNGLVADGLTINPEYYDGKYFYCFSIRGLSAGTYEFGVECVAKKTDAPEATSVKTTVTVTVDASGNATVS